MKKGNKNISPANNIDDYLLRLEKQEKAKSRKKGIFALLLIGILVAGFISTKFISFEKSLDVYQFEDLDSDILSEMIHNKQLPILVAHPDLGTDTVFGMDDYTVLLNLSYTMESNKALKVAENNSDEFEIQSVENDIPVTALDVVGKREKGNKLKFVIENYDPEIQYEIDFGNGYKTKVGKAVNYSYPKAGNFRIKLISSKGDQSRIYTKRVKIKKSEIQIAQNITRDNEKESEITSTDQNELPDGSSAQTEVEEMEEIPAQIQDVTEDSGNNDSDLEIKDLQKEKSKKTEVNPTVIQEPILKEKIEQPAQIPTPKPKSKTTKKVPATAPISFAQLMPEFPGGSGSFSRFIRKNYRYPQKAINYGVEGVVLVRFVVNPDGTLTDPYVIKGIGHGCDEEAIRLVSKMPKWIPGENDGVKVSVYQTIPVTFKLDD